MKICQKNNLDPETIYQTQDIQLAASLCALGMGLLDIDRVNPDRCAFVFRGSQDLMLSVDLYWQRRLSIEPQVLLSALKAIKSRLYGERV